MTRVQFAPDSGRLRLDRSTFDTLIALVDGRVDRRDGAAAELRAGGVLDAEDAPHAAIRAALQAVADPVCRLVLRMQHAQGRREIHEGWAASHAVALLLAADEDGELLELVNLHPSFMPEALARLVGLGPRPRASSVVPVRLTSQIIDALTGSDPTARSGAAKRLLAVASSTEQRATAQALGGGVRCRWEAVLSWDAPAGVAGSRAVHVLDTPVGLWLLEPAGSGLLAWPSTPTRIWRVLASLLPKDRELARVTTTPGAFS